MKNSKNWSVEDLNSLYSMKNSGQSFIQIALALGKTWQSCASKYVQFNWDQFFSNQLLDGVEKCVKMSAKKLCKKEQSSDRQGQKEQYLRKMHESKIQSQDKKNIRTQIIADRIQNAIKALPTVPKPMLSSKAAKGKLKQCEQMGLMLSDIHIGASFTLEQTGGLAQFNLDIAKRRLQNLTKATIEIYNLHSKLYDIPTLNIFSLGDIVAGMNDAGAWSPVYIDMCIYDQMVQGFEAMARMIYEWLKVFKNIEFWGVSGNHGRVSKAGVEKEYANWDYMCHKFLQAKFKDNPRVKFHLPKAWWQLAKIKNHKFLLVHGQDVKAGGSPITGLKNLEQKMIGVTKQIPDYTLAGHFHTSSQLRTNSGKVMLNGSVVGPDIYSLKNLQSSSKPQQKLFGIHGTRGITYSYEIGLDDAR